MGIRYNRDSRRATNGPMIFFSDPSAEINLQDEIRGAISSRLCFYAYRRPGDMIISFGSSECTVEGIGVPGFVISSFDSAKPTVTIPWHPVRVTYEGNTTHYRFPEESTTYSRYSDEITEIQNMLRQLGRGKTVASRVICLDTPTDVAATFTSLCREYPFAFVFAFSTPQTGCWVGASPELLLSASSGRYYSMALAGTRQIGDAGEWDIKNLEEQKMVADFIGNCFAKHGLDITLGDTFTQPAGRIEHICTPVTATIPSGFGISRLTSLLFDLSPTPAVCGFPRQESLSLIKRMEGHERGCYGGFCGPYSSESDFSFYVNLRCALIEKSRCALFAGGGITLRSDANEEWKETGLKAETIRSALVKERTAPDDVTNT